MICEQNRNSEPWFFRSFVSRQKDKEIRSDFYRTIVKNSLFLIIQNRLLRYLLNTFFFNTYPTFFSAKKVAKKLESSMRSISPILRLDSFGDFYRTTSRCPTLSSIQSFSYASFHFLKKFVFFCPCRLLFWIIVQGWNNLTTLIH